MHQSFVNCRCAHPRPLDGETSPVLIKSMMGEKAKPFDMKRMAYGGFKPLVEL